MAVIRVTCPSCEGVLKLEEPGPEGKRVRCPKCQEVFKIPGAKAAPSVKSGAPVTNRTSATGKSGPTKRRPSAEDEPLLKKHKRADEEEDQDEQEEEEERPRIKKKRNKKAGLNSRRKAGVHPGVLWGGIGGGVVALFMAVGLILYFCGVFNSKSTGSDASRASGATPTTPYKIAPARDNAPGQIGGPPDKEDPIVLDYFKKNGWNVICDKNLIWNLMVVSLSRNTALESLTAEDLKMITRSKTIQCLRLQAPMVSDSDLKVLGGILRLESLNLSHGFTDVGIRQLGQLPELRELWLGGTYTESLKLNGTCFEAFATSRSLKLLAVSNCNNLTDEGVKQLARLSSLEYLLFDSVNLDDAGFQQLLRLPKLKQLQVAKTNVSMEAYRQAKKDHPQIEISGMGK